MRKFLLALGIVATLCAPARALDPLCVNTGTLSIIKCPAGSRDWYDSYVDIIDTLNSFASSVASSTGTASGAVSSATTTLRTDLTALQNTVSTHSAASDSFHAAVTGSTNSLRLDLSSLLLAFTTNTVAQAALNAALTASTDSLRADHNSLQNAFNVYGSTSATEEAAYRAGQSAFNAALTASTDSLRAGVNANSVAISTNADAQAAVNAAQASLNSAVAASTVALAAFDSAVTASTDSLRAGVTANSVAISTNATAQAAVNAAQADFNGAVTASTDSLRADHEALENAFNVYGSTHDADETAYRAAQAGFNAAVTSSTDSLKAQADANSTAISTNAAAAQAYTDDLRNDFNVYASTHAEEEAAFRADLAASTSSLTGGGGDNFGDHTATKPVDMGGYAIYNSTSVEAGEMKTNRLRVGVGSTLPPIGSAFIGQDLTGSGPNSLAVGEQNTVGGNASFAGGYQATASNDRCFVWNGSDSGGSSCNTEQFVVKADAGIFFYGDTDLNGGKLTSGASVFTSTSVSSTELTANSICLSGDCETTWPSGGGLTEGSSPTITGQWDFSNRVDFSTDVFKSGGITVFGASDYNPQIAAAYEDGQFGVSVVPFNTRFRFASNSLSGMGIDLCRFGGDLGGASDCVFFQKQPRGIDPGEVTWQNAAPGQNPIFGGGNTIHAFEESNPLGADIHSGYVNASSTGTIYEGNAGYFIIVKSTGAHFGLGGSTVTVSACGASPALEYPANDNAGALTTGTGTVNSCTVTFGKKYTHEPVCHVANETQPDLYMGTVATRNTLTISNATSFDADRLKWFCVERR